MRSSIFHNTENTSQEHEKFVMQNDHMLLVNLDGEVYAKQGAMAAYQGDIDFEYHGGGLSRAFKKLVTGEDLSLMKCSGRGDLFLADNGSEVFTVQLENEQLTLNNNNILAFDSSIQWDIDRIRAGVMGIAAGGLFNVTLTGTGNVAVTSWGKPVVISVDQPVAVDSNCIIAWSTSLQVAIKTTLKAGMIIGRSSGEAVQMLFSGQGFVIVQPGEGLIGLLMRQAS
ncbi:MAG TPA: AIM24 family protein [Candidatus Saccharimonadales bacterium]|nr:AIM24 family protein [Candidatus Saccharimonadales bacterium]